MKALNTSLAAVLALVMLSACGSSPELTPTLTATNTSSPHDVTLLHQRANVVLDEQIPLRGVLELDGTCVVLGGDPLVFAGDAYFEQPDRIVALGATLVLGSEVADTLAWGEVPIEGGRLAATDSRINDEQIQNLDDCPPTRYGEYVIVTNLDATE